MQLKHQVNMTKALEIKGAQFSFSHKFWKGCQKV